jgi:hypothetical protein
VNIQQAMLKAMAAISATGIGKTSSANLGGATVKYRGVEAAMNVMSPILIASGITVTARYSDLQITERAKAEAGKATRFCTLKGTFTFTADDGSSVVAECFGEAMDSGDKATVKAQSVAFRTALFQQFVVPTMAMDPEADGDEDDDPDNLLGDFRQAAMQGEAALRKHYEAHTPSEAFWKAHGPALKDAAKKADKVAA